MSDGGHWSEGAGALPVPGGGEALEQQGLGRRRAPDHVHSCSSSRSPAEQTWPPCWPGQGSSGRVPHPACQTGSGLPCGGGGGGSSQEREPGLSDAPHRHQRTQSDPRGHTRPPGCTAHVVRRWIHLTRWEIRSVLEVLIPSRSPFQLGAPGDHTGLPSPTTDTPAESPRQRCHRSVRASAELWQSCAGVAGGRLSRGQGQPGPASRGEGGRGDSQPSTWQGPDRQTDRGGRQ